MHMPASKKSRRIRPLQSQKQQPGRQRRMTPQPQADAAHYQPAGKLIGKVALITGGDSGIGRAIAVAFAKEGADIAIAYLEEREDADETARLIAAAGRRCLLVRGDIGRERFCESVVTKTIRNLGRLDILVNNAAEQHPQEDVSKITAVQVARTFNTNIISAFHLLRYALPHLAKGSSIIMTSSVVAYRGSSHLVDYGATKAAQIGFARSLAMALAKRGIRVNAVAPGPIWTPLIPSTFPAKHVAKFGSDVPMGRAGQPDEVAPAFVYLASADSSYVTGQCIHVNGGEVING